MLVVASSLAVLALLAFAVSLIVLCERGRDRNATGGAGGGDPRCEISEIRTSLGFAYDANLDRCGAPLSPDCGPVMFASLVFVGHNARRARRLPRGAIV
jgi:hypothetical protein